ncbi:serine/threonine-protein kinase [Actinoplanes sp. NPDC051494]|uniref:serine/threonine-protein kinase n=1 Tax=Actinoplanes sp. NPDC051494 TaxID=3363907 RepID=UPI0037996F77
MPTKPLRPHDPRVLGEYELLGVIGEGGMGAVYLARGRSGEPVAVKIIRPEYAVQAEFRGRFRSEVNRARQVPPFCTAAVLDADPGHETPYLVVEYVDGPDLATIVTAQGSLTRGALHGVAVGVATALVAIHGAGVIHRDLKPRNVLFALGSPKVIDFGIARAFESTSEHTRTDQMVGTLSYMAPERLDGKPVTPAVDVFAWGVLVAYAATGRTPFDAGSPTATAVRILTGEPDLDGLTGDLRDLVARALNKEPMLRPTAQELLDMLLGEGPATTPAPPAPRRRKRVAAAAAATALALALGVFLGLRSDNDVTCPGPATTFAGDQSVAVTLEDMSEDACALVSFRRIRDARYEFIVCADNVAAAVYAPSGAVSTLSGAAMTVDHAARHQLRIDVVAEIATFRIDDTKVLTAVVDDPGLTEGAVALGMTQLGEGAGSVRFSRFEAR